MLPAVHVQNITDDSHTSRWVEIVDSEESKSCWQFFPLERSAWASPDSSCKLDRVASVKWAMGNLTLHSGTPSIVRWQMMLGTVNVGKETVWS